MKNSIWVAITLWKLATNIEYRTLSEMFGVGNSRVGIVVIETCKSIVTYKYVSIPTLVTN